DPAPHELCRFDAGAHADVVPVRVDEEKLATVAYCVAQKRERHQPRAIGIPAANAGLSRRLAEPVCSGIDQLKAIAAEEDSVDFPVRRAVLSADAKHRALRQMIAQKCRLIAQHLLRTQEIRIE